MGAGGCPQGRWVLMAGCGADGCQWVSVGLMGANGCPWGRRVPVASMELVGASECSGASGSLWG